MALTHLIRQKIAQEGPISFRDFMNMCLYHPGMGYYTSPNEKQGKEGDYYTSPVLSSSFGIMLGRQLEEMWRISGGQEFTIVEYGAGSGALSSAILAYLKVNKELYDNLSYNILEKNQALREKGRARVSNEKVIWSDSVLHIPEITGCVLSNELIDNFPVHRVIMLDELMEVFVAYTDRFIEVLKPARKELKAYFAELKIELPKGFRTEINLDAILWIKEIAVLLKKGYVLTIDYGYPSHELYARHRSHGTLVCYHQHQINYDPYRNIGKQDITTHINFSALCLWGNKYGLDFCGFRDQGNFLQALGFREFIKKEKQAADHYSAYLKKELLTETLLADMGTKLKVLIQQKDMPEKELVGLKTTI